MADSKTTDNQSDDVQGLDHGKRFASWNFHEFQAYKRSIGWYIVAAIVVIGLFIIALRQKNYLFVVIIALITFIYLILNQRKPRLVTFSISEDGLEVHETFYPFKDIKKFWIIYEPPEVKILYFDFQSGLRPILSIPLESQNPLKIRDILIKYIKEDLERDEELLSDAVLRSLKL